MKTLVIPYVHVPFQCREAETNTHKIITKHKPNKIIFLGDVADLHALTVHRRNPYWFDRLEAELDAVEEYIEKIRKKAGNKCEIIWIKGNHEDRWSRAIESNIPAMRSINYSLPDVLNLKDYNVKWVEDAGKTPVITPTSHGQKVRFMHGHEIRGGSAFPVRHALKMAKLLGCNLHIGHTHRFGLMGFTMPNRKQPFFCIEGGLVADKEKAGMRYAYPNTDWVKYVSLYDDKKKESPHPTFISV